jgi:hypothetical protein
MAPVAKHATGVIEMQDVPKVRSEVPLSTRVIGAGPRWHATKVKGQKSPSVTVECPYGHKTKLGKKYAIDAEGQVEPEFRCMRNENGPCTFKAWIRLLFW